MSWLVAKCDKTHYSQCKKTESLCLLKLTASHMNHVFTIKSEKAFIREWVILFNTNRSASLLTAPISTVPMGLSWKTYTNTDGLLCHPDLKALLKHVNWLCYHYWQEVLNLEAEGYAACSVTLAQFQTAQKYTARHKACLFLLTHLYSVNCHSLGSDASEEYLTNTLFNTLRKG